MKQTLTQQYDNTDSGKRLAKYELIQGNKLNVTIQITANEPYHHLVDKIKNLLKLLEE